MDTQVTAIASGPESLFIEAEAGLSKYLNPTPIMYSLGEQSKQERTYKSILYETIQQEMKHFIHYAVIISRFLYIFFHLGIKGLKITNERLHLSFN